MQSFFQASRVSPSGMKEAVAFIAKASKKISVLFLSCRYFLARQILQCKSACGTVRRFSQYLAQSIHKKATDGA